MEDRALHRRLDPDLSERAVLVGSLTSPLDARRLTSLASSADILEVRADLVGRLDPDWLRNRFPGRLLYTLRSSAEGGASDEASSERQARLAEAATDFDLVDLELERDLDPDLLARLPAERRLISWHGTAAGAISLEKKLDRMLAVPAACYKLVAAASTASEAVVPLALLRRRGRRDVIAFAGGVAGAWTRLLAPRLGAPWVFGALGERPAAPGQPSLDTLRLDYGLPELPPARLVCGVVGAPVQHSLSPRLHNGLYRRLDIEALYLPFHVETFGRFWLDFVEQDLVASIGYTLRGLSITSPHKRIALAVAGASSPLAGRIGAANTLVERRGVWEAEATDAAGVVLPLLDGGVEVRGKSAAVVGAGGAGLSAAVGLTHAGARVRLFNRSADRARKAATRLGLDWAPIDALEIGRFDILVNATPLGREEAEGPPFDVAGARAGAAVVDMVYRRQGATPLVEAARKRHLRVVDGREMLLYQAAEQFHMMTGEELPLDTGRQLLRDR